MLPLSEYSSLIDKENDHISDIYRHSFILKNYSPTVDFGLYHSSEGPLGAGNTGISVNILQPGVRTDLTFFYTQPTLTSLAALS